MATWCEIKLFCQAFGLKTKVVLVIRPGVDRLGNSISAVVRPIVVVVSRIESVKVLFREIGIALLPVVLVLVQVHSCVVKVLLEK